jgi:putative N6-adenine-specific DNA methylase
MTKFSLTILPGLEDLAKSEFIEKWSFINESEVPKIERKKGKLYIEADVSDFCSIVAYLKIPSQAYIIVEEFPCKDFPKFFQKVSKIEWHKYVRGNFPIITVSAKQSKLINSTRIKLTATEGLTKAFKKTIQKKAPKEFLEIKNKIHIDIYNDDVTISLSLSGDRLDKRGYKLSSDVAPLRESIAAALVFSMALESKTSSLLDPMAGTGTFTSEALEFYKFNNHRLFDYQFAPFFITLPLKKRVTISKALFKSHFINDISNHASIALNDNLERLSKDHEVKNFGPKDFFTINDKFENSSLIINPPYGKRIKISVPLDELITSIIKKAKELEGVEKIGLIFPRWAKSKLKDIKVLKETFLTNGGIEVVYLLIDLR